MTYNVDLRDKITGDTVTTMLETDNYDKAWEFADSYNNAHGITADEYALLESEESEGWTPHPYWASVYEIETENKEDNKMDYQKQIEKAVQEFYDVTKAFATSRHYTLSYWWVESNFGLDLSDKQTRMDVNEMSYNNGFEDKIQCLDFDDIKKEVTIMIWEKGEGKANGEVEMKKYTLENYKEFCDEVLVAPPIEEFDDGTIDELEWYNTHKIRIAVGEHEIEIDYLADAVNEIDYSLREIHEAILGSGEATTGNIVGNQYRDATWKDILRLNVARLVYESVEFKTAVQRTIKFFDADAFRKCMTEIEEHPGYIDEYEVNFNKIGGPATDMGKIFDATERQKAFEEMLCQNIEIEELIDKDGKHSDRVVITDHSILLSGHFVGWHYGVDFDANSVDNQWYIKNYIKEMVK